MNRFALAYREQQQLFLWDKTYLAGTLLKVGGCATLIAQFVVQFFYNPTVALVLTLCLLALLAGLLWLALRQGKEDWALLPFCLIPALLWGACLSDHALHYDALIAALMATGSLAIYARIERRRLLWGSLLSLVLYALAGPAALLFALCAWILDLFQLGAWGWKSILFAVLAFLCGAVALWLSAVPTWAAALTPVFYYDLDTAMPSVHLAAWLSIPLALLLALLARKWGRSLSRRWYQAAIGAVLAVVLTYFKVPALAFALGMFIPLELNIPLLVGGAINSYVTSRSKDAEVNKERGDKGTLIASGFIAGGALMGVVSALLRFGGFNPISESWLANPLSEVCSLAAYILLICYFVKATKK